jgi:Protein of unknown function/Domain of unknown function (DUF1835)
MGYRVVSRSLLSPLHLALGESAAGCLRAAPGLPGSVFCIPDDLSHGPLGDGAARAAYLRACLLDYGDWLYDLDNAFAPWQELVERLDRDSPDAVVIWAGENVSEAILLAMTCDRLAKRPEPLLLVTVPGKYGRNYVAVHAPEELTEFYAIRRVLSHTERARLAQDFVRLRDHTGLLRRWEDGRVIGVPVDYYDSLLLDACGAEWNMAAHVVGMAMGRCDAANSLGDIFFSTRSRALITADRIAADGPRSALRYYSVRRSVREGSSGAA